MSNSASSFSKGDTGRVAPMTSTSAVADPMGRYLMAEDFLYLTTTGRKSGESRQIEIWFAARGGCYYLVSERRERSHWVQNILCDSRVGFSVGRRGDMSAVRPECTATARVIEAESEPELAREVSALMDAKYGWSDGLIVEIRPDG